MKLEKVPTYTNFLKEINVQRIGLNNFLREKLKQKKSRVLLWSLYQR